METKDIILTDAQWADFQASAEYRNGFEAGVFSSVDAGVGAVQLFRPDGATLIATAVRQSIWQVS